MKEKIFEINDDSRDFYFKINGFDLKMYLDTYDIKSNPDYKILTINFKIPSDEIRIKVDL